MPRVLVSNAGTIRVFRVAEELDRHDLLAYCATSLYYEPEFFKRIPVFLRSQVERAAINRRRDVLTGKVVTHNFPELAHLIAGKLGIGKAATWITWRNRRFGEWVARHSLDDIDVVWSFDTSSLEIFEAAKKSGIRCILDMSIAHPKLGQRILRDHAERRPEYAADLEDDVSEGQMERRLREMELADCLVAGSSFVADSLISEEIPANKIRINPYGVSLEEFSGNQRLFTGEPPIFLFVGWFSQRKGIYYLLEAWERTRLGDMGAKLRIVGGTRKDLYLWRGLLPAGIEILGRLPHSQLPAVYADADVFVLPSLFEGFAKTLLEAMASGLPIITTPHACDATVVIDGENGFLEKPGDVVGLASAMQKLGQEPALRKSMSIAASNISSRYSWDIYGERCRDICLEVFSGRAG